eukprot:COSAG06_NODE_907_length_11611_cov_13.405316_13_plen_42_part_00
MGLAAVLSFAPDFWLNIGDIIYADVPVTGGIGTFFHFKLLG